MYKLNQNGCIDDGDILLHELTGLDESENIGGKVENNEEEEEEEEENNSNAAINVDNASTNRKAKKKRKSKKSTPVILPAAAPFIVYSLQDYDILEDWHLLEMHNNIKSGTSATTS